MKEECNLVKHAKKEFEILGWPGDDSMQKMICDNIIELLQCFSNQGHSGFSANYALNLFKKLANFDPIAPLTGDKSEWNDISGSSGEPMWQNNRDSEIFKGIDGKAYWISGKIFVDKHGCSYTSRDSQVFITFPWTKPKLEIIYEK